LKEKANLFDQAYKNKDGMIQRDEFEDFVKKRNQ